MCVNVSKDDKYIDRWSKRPLEPVCLYLFVDGVWHKRTWGGSVESVDVLVVADATKVMKEDRSSREKFIRTLVERELKEVRLIVGDQCARLVSAVNAMFRGRYRRCTVHVIRNVLSTVSHRHVKCIALVLKAIFAMKNCRFALEKFESVTAEMKDRGLEDAASCLREGHRGDDHLPARRLSRRAAAQDSHEQYNRTVEQGDSQEDTRRLVPGKKEHTHTCLYSHLLRHCPASGACFDIPTYPGSTVSCSQPTENRTRRPVNSFCTRLQTQGGCVLISKKKSAVLNPFIK